MLTNIVPLSADTYYSLFLVDSLKKIKLVSVRDRIIVPGSDSAAVRFLQFSPNTPLPYGTVTKQHRHTLNSPGELFNDQVSDTTRSTFKPLKAGTYSLALYLMGRNTIHFVSKYFTRFRKRLQCLLVRFYEGTGAQALDKSIIQHTR